ISSFAIGFFVAFFFLVVVGSVGYGVSRLRHSGRTWGNVVLSGAAMVTTAFLLVASAAGRATQHQNALDKASPNPSGTSVEREKANQEAATWGRSRARLFHRFTATAKRTPVF